MSNRESRFMDRLLKVGGRGCPITLRRPTRCLIVPESPIHNIPMTTCRPLTKTACHALSGFAISLLLTASSYAAPTPPTAEWTPDSGSEIASGVTSPVKYHTGEPSNILIGFLMLVGILMWRRSAARP